ncbi:uncharacterized protein LOC141858626 [Brevipalpus obovatus]|uniref:uncharacterized protein LOC141858626 n=1 Tax=Brevipalpus obovatus TaxID=246614 RepID=UPI003D9E5137
MDCSHLEFQVGDELTFREGDELWHGTVMTIRLKELDESLTMEVKCLANEKFKGIWTYTPSEIAQSIKELISTHNSSRPGGSDEEREKERKYETCKCFKDSPEKG